MWVENRVRRERPISKVQYPISKGRVLEPVPASALCGGHRSCVEARSFPGTRVSLEVYCLIDTLDDGKPRLSAGYFSFFSGFIGSFRDLGSGCQTKTIYLLPLHPGENVEDRWACWVREIVRAHDGRFPEQEE